VLTSKRKNYGAHSNLRALTGQIIDQPLNDCQKVGKPRWLRQHTIYGTPELGTSNTLEKRRHAVCATVRQKTGDMC
jgi:hypothetical protein